LPCKDQGSYNFTALDWEKLSDFGLFNHWESQLFGEKVFIARTGYTGEDGFEIMAAPEIGQQLWTEFLNLGVTPCGLGRGIPCV
jgi:aminomethyltransferase